MISSQIERNKKNQELILPGILRWQDLPVHCRPQCLALHSCSSCSAWRGHSWSWPCCCWPLTWGSCRTGRRRRRSRCGKIPRREEAVAWSLLYNPPAPSLCCVGCSVLVVWPVGQQCSGELSAHLTATLPVCQDGTEPAQSSQRSLPAQPSPHWVSLSLSSLLWHFYNNYVWTNWHCQTVSLQQYATWNRENYTHNNLSQPRGS